jgi:hypothetical protein
MKIAHLKKDQRGTERKVDGTGKEPRKEDTKGTKKGQKA